MHTSSRPEIDAYWREACALMGVDESSRHYAYTFADPELGRADIMDELVQFALVGRKRGTAHMQWDFEINQIPMREVGDYWIVLTSSNEPAGIVRVTAVRVTAFNEVDADFAASEGEGDLSLEFWRRVHRSYFQKQCAQWARDWREDTPVVCESFELVYPDKRE